MPEPPGPAYSSVQSHFNRPFITTLDVAAEVNASDEPNYYASDPTSLISASTVTSFMTGTGDAIYRSLAPLLESTNHELILVTCFWARSSSLDTLSSILRKLSDKAVQRGTEKIRVRLCFSSLSLFQKLFHKQSLLGQKYASSTWVKKLGLPDQSELGGLDLQVKSIFLLPFSVMHPKFMIIDRQTVILPSCNISWEEWFEGCITLSGPIVDQFLKFYNLFWDRGPVLPLSSPGGGKDDTRWQAERLGTSDLGHGHVVTHLSTGTKTPDVSDIATVFLPSPHRRNPRFQPFRSLDKVVAPPTPLNAFLLTLFARAEKSIHIQTPNLTSPPVLSSILKALERGVFVRILTSERLMVLEQLVTGGTTTSRCVDRLIKRHKRLKDFGSDRIPTDEEAAISAPRPGRLIIQYFEPFQGPKGKDKEGGEPQQSHLKMTIVDNEVLVLGSGNLDRASWFTSQELGVAFFDKGLAGRVGDVVSRAMQGRFKVVYDSEPRRR